MRIKDWKLIEPYVLAVHHDDGRPRHDSTAGCGQRRHGESARVLTRFTTATFGRSEIADVWAHFTRRPARLAECIKVAAQHQARTKGKADSKDFSHRGTSSFGNKFSLNQYSAGDTSGE